MSKSKTINESTDSSAEIFRLCLSKLGKYKLAITPINYALFYFYLSGNDLDLNERIDNLLKQPQSWNDEVAEALFNRYICQFTQQGNENNHLKKELLGTIANILGMLIDLAGKSALSNESLEVHMKKLASTQDPGDILHIASDIIAETRIFVDETQKFEASLVDTTQEIKTLKNELDDARREATKDALTGLNNRRGFDKALQASIKISQSGLDPFCLMLLDIDLFKVINDSYGHLVGDKVLVGLSKVFIKNMRGSDYLCRYGGEEFAIIMPETLITGAFTVAEKLRKSVEKLRLKHIKTGQQIGQVTISIGVTSYRSNDTEVEIIDRCDRALYRAKSLGRNRTVIAD